MAEKFEPVVLHREAAGGHDLAQEFCAPLVGVEVADAAAGEAARVVVVVGADVVAGRAVAVGQLGGRAAGDERLRFL